MRISKRDIEAYEMGFDAGMRALKEEIRDEMNNFLKKTKSPLWIDFSLSLTDTLNECYQQVKWKRSKQK